jgi:hypothetical protein
MLALSSLHTIRSIPISEAGGAILLLFGICFSNLNRSAVDVYDMIQNLLHTETP